MEHSEIDHEGAGRIEALRRELRGLPLPPAAMPLEYARVWRERMLRHRAIADIMLRHRSPGGRTAPKEGARP